MEQDLIKNLKIDHWSTFILGFGVALIVIALKTKIMAISNLDLLVIASGLSLIGLGEKFNHQWSTVIIPPNIYLTGGQTLRGEGYLRKNTIFGILFDIIGVSLILYRLYKIIS